MTEKRRLEISASMKDGVSGPMRIIGKSLTTGFNGALVAVRGFGQALTSVRGILAGVFAGAAFQRGASAFQDLIGGLDQVNAQAAATNTSASSLLLLRDAAAQNGVQFEQLAAAVRTFQKNLGDARQGAKTQTETLRRLGLSSEQFAGTQKDAVEQLAQVADGLATVEDASIRSNLALKLFGEDTGAALLPILAQGGQALRDYAAAQRLAGRALSNEEIQRASQYRQALADLTLSFRRLGEQLSIDIAPILSEFFRELRTLVEENSGVIRDSIADLAGVFVTVAETVIDLTFGLKQAAQGLDLLGKALAAVYLDLAGTNEEAAVSQERFEALARSIRGDQKAWSELGTVFDRLRDRLAKLRQERENFASLPNFTVTVTGSVGEEAQQASSQWSEFFDGFAENSKRARDRWTDFRQAGLDAANTIVDQGLNNLSNALADWILTQGKGIEVWKALAKQILSDLAKIIARLIVVNTVSSLFGSSTSGGSGGGGTTVTAETGGAYQGTIVRTIPIQRFERGGIVRQPTLAIFGEGRASKGEAFVPLPDGRRIPVALDGGGGGGTVNITIQAWDGQDATRALYKQRGTLRALWQQDLSRVQAVRQNVRSAAG